MLQQVPEILRAIPEERIVEMQTNIGKVWHRCGKLCCELLGLHTRKECSAACSV